MGEREREKHRYGKIAMNKYLSIIILNVNELNAPIERHKVAEWIRKHDLHICCLQETHLRTKDLYRLKVKGWKKYSKQMNTKRKLGENQDGGVGGCAAPPRTTRTDRESNSKGDQHQGNRK